jgi:hypothetical protein
MTASLHERRFGKHSPASEEYGVERKGETHFMSNVVLKKITNNNN